MDCYIVRVYRRMAGKGGQDSEIAGLVERVGDVHDSKAFSSCQGLINMLRGEQSSEQRARRIDAKTASAEVVRIAPDTAGR